MALYGTLAAIKELLNPVVSGAFSADETARITALQKLASAVIEDKTGAVFGDSTAETVVVASDDGGGALLLLPKGIRTVTSITENPTWTLGAWTGGTALTTTAYRLTSLWSNGSYRTITRMDGGWSGTYVIAGVWEDKYPTVPDDLTYIANRMAAEIFKSENASPHGLVGPEGALVPVRDALRITEIQEVIAKYRVGPLGWVV